ncbi:arsenate reductase ArsC [Arthrobacter sp. CAL618]|uniref:arsenate reductase ArsC n=1 Tax=Arthrobacter sp. CAL618 TaxID=1055770 RepID=UPI00041463C1|nr:arsenate reductase ArsC [Arthrobacter sp. CAL618]
MTSDQLSSRAIAKPLDDHSATELAYQLSAVADPVRLRVLSLLAVSSDHHYRPEGLSQDLDLESDVTEDALDRLVRAGLVEHSSAGTLAPSADAWIRFGRLLTKPSTAAQPSIELSSYDRRLIAAGTLIASRGSDQEILPDIIVRIADQLSHRFAANFSHDTVYRYVGDTYLLLQERAKVKRFLPSLTSRFATDRLTALASARGLTLHRVPEILFVCVRNGGRSQIAASILKQLAGDRLNVRSAGSTPGEGVDPTVVRLLDEIGISVAGEYPKPLTDEIVQASDFVITMGCGDACPVYPGRRYLDWAIEDPLGLTDDQVRQIRDEIYDRVKSLLPELVTPR